MEPMVNRRDHTRRFHGCLSKHTMNKTFFCINMYDKVKKTKKNETKKHACFCVSFYMIIRSSSSSCLWLAIHIRKPKKLSNKMCRYRRAYMSLRGFEHKKIWKNYNLWLCIARRWNSDESESICVYAAAASWIHRERFFFNILFWQETT